MVKVEKIKVIPQPFGSFFDLILNDEGKLKDPDKIRERVGIIDIGFQTTDLALATPQFIESSSGSLDVGVRSVADQLSRDVSRKYSITLDTTEAEEALRHKSVRIFGESVDLADMIEERTREVAELILSYAHSLWGRGERLNRLILAGGGANILPLLFQHLSQSPRPRRTVSLECQGLPKARPENQVVMPRKRITLSLDIDVPSDKAIFDFLTGLPKRTRSEIIKEILLDALENRDEKPNTGLASNYKYERCGRNRSRRDHREAFLTLTFGETSLEAIDGEKKTGGRPGLVIVILALAHVVLYFAPNLYLPFDLEELFLLGYALVLAGQQPRRFTWN